MRDLVKIICATSSLSQKFIRNRNEIYPHSERILSAMQVEIDLYLDNFVLEICHLPDVFNASEKAISSRRFCPKTPNLTRFS